MTNEETTAKVRAIIEGTDTSHADECTGDHDDVSGACITEDFGDE